MDRSLLTGPAWLTSDSTETAIVDKPADEDEHAGHTHHHAGPLVSDPAIRLSLTCVAPARMDILDDPTSKSPN
jgi:hypothetical protein